MTTAEKMTAPATVGDIEQVLERLDGMDQCFEKMDQRFEKMEKRVKARWSSKDTPRKSKTARPRLKPASSPNVKAGEYGEPEKGEAS